MPCLCQNLNKYVMCGVEAKLWFVLDNTWIEEVIHKIQSMFFLLTIISITSQHVYLFSVYPFTIRSTLYTKTGNMHQLIALIVSDQS